MSSKRKPSPIENLLTLKNPHSVLAALESRREDVVEIALPNKINAEGWENVKSLAQRLNVRITSRDSRDLRDARDSRDSRDQGRTGFAFATVRERAPLPIEELFKPVAQKKSKQGLWIALDSLQDPQNVGAIFRSAAFFGVSGILMTTERSAPLTGTVYDVASGGMESVPFSMVVNLQQAFNLAKEAGLWILGTSEHAHDDYSTVALDRPWLMVLGNEEQGMRRLTEESCDVLCRISAKGKVGSLDVSVAAGILIAKLAP